MYDIKALLLLAGSLALGRKVEKETAITTGYQHMRKTLSKAQKERGWTEKEIASIMSIYGQKGRGDEHQKVKHIHHKMPAATVRSLMLYKAIDRKSSTFACLCLLLQMNRFFECEQ
ncbi:hypothetical protein BJX61DRAFT_201952 [Aspergillus egyptiacus]|nr:hypothetical protein BJX61DRAFT_201952 [Aspergillus egyptiacus]